MTTTRPEPGPAPARRRSASSPRRPATAGSGRSSRRIPSSSPRCRSPAPTRTWTPADDLARVIEASWGERVRANREQVERIREVPDGADFYAPVTSLFRADPTRTDDPVLARCSRSSGRATRGSTSAPAPAGSRCRSPARLDPSGGSVVALDAVALDARGPARDRRGLRHRERPDRRGALAAGRRRARAGVSRPTSRSSPTSATTSRRSGRSSTRWRRPPAGSASPS